MANDLILADGYSSDRLENVVAHLAYGKAKTVSDRFGIKSIDDAELSAMYRCEWLARKVIDIPVADALRPGRNWQADNDLIEIIEAQERRHQVWTKVEQALTWGRLYGGAAILVLNGEDPFLPLRQINKGQLRALVAVSRLELTPGQLSRDPEAPNFREPDYYYLNVGQRDLMQVHWTRVVRFVGAPRPDVSISGDGWGDSILQVVYDAIHHAALANSGVAELIHEAKVDVIKMRNLESHLSTPNGTALVQNRFALANMLKSINNMLLLGDGDEWDRKQTNFSTLPDIVKTFLQIVAGAADIPATRLLGTSPGGLNSTGDSDIRNYYDGLDGWRKKHIKPQLERIDEILWRDAMGSVPADAWWKFAPLWQMTEKEAAEVADKKAETTKKYADLGIFSEEVLFEITTNQLIEDGTYPALEAAIATLRARGDGPENDQEEDDPDQSED